MLANVDLEDYYDKNCDDVDDNEEDASKLSSEEPFIASGKKNAAAEFFCQSGQLSATVKWLTPNGTGYQRLSVTGYQFFSMSKGLRKLLFRSKKTF